MNPLTSHESCVITVIIAVLNEAERIARVPTESVDAYQTYLKAERRRRSITTEAIRDALAQRNLPLQFMYLA